VDGRVYQREEILTNKEIMATLIIGNSPFIKKHNMDLENLGGESQEPIAGLATRVWYSQKSDFETIIDTKKSKMKIQTM